MNKPDYVKSDWSILNKGLYFNYNELKFVLNGKRQVKYILKYNTSSYQFQKIIEITLLLTKMQSNQDEENLIPYLCKITHNYLILIKNQMLNDRNLIINQTVNI